MISVFRIPERSLRAAALGVVLASSIPYVRAATQNSVRIGTPGPLPEISYREAVERAWDRLPDRRNFAASQDVARARGLSGSALFPNAPTASGNYINDKIAGSNENYITTQVELTTPIWLPGEGTATQRLAQADSDAAQAGEGAAHLALASDVLDRALAVVQAEGETAIARERREAADALVREASARLRTGEGAEADLLAAQAERAGAAMTLHRSEAQREAARAPLEILIGEAAVPRLDVPALVLTTADRPEPDMLARHPRMAAAAGAVDAARAGDRLTHIQNRDDPELGMQVINEKQPGTRWDTRVGVVMRFSFATQARNAPRFAEAAAQLTKAEVQLDQVRRGILAGVRAARADLAGTQAAAQDAAIAADAQDRRLRMVQRAWRLGESPLIELVRAEAAAYDAALERTRSRAAFSAARLRLALAEGVIP